MRAWVSGTLSIQAIHNRYDQIVIPTQVLESIRWQQSLCLYHGNEFRDGRGGIVEEYTEEGQKLACGVGSSLAGDYLETGL
jgi:hypothetical protein